MSAHLSLDETKAANLAELIELLRIPSVSAAQDSSVMQPAVDWLTQKLASLGAEVRELGSDGFPILFATIKGDSDKSLLFYNHYDVQPPEPLEDWTSPPFEPTIRGTRLYGRGTDDNKGSLMSRIHAVEAVLRDRGSLPVTVKFLIEGEEESGSTSLPPTVAKNAELLRSDACIWENARCDDDGNPTMTLGNKGMVSFELRVRTASADSHSGKANLYPNAIWRLVHALACLKGPDGKILVEGMLESVAEMTETDIAICEGISANGPAQARKLGLETLLPGNDNLSVNKALFFTPSLNIQGIAGGYTGSGYKTVNPATAMARLEARLVGGMDPEAVKGMIAAHLAKHGFDDVTIVAGKSGQPYYTRTNSPFVKLVAEAGEAVWGKKVTVLPSSPGSGPRYVFKYAPDMPIVALGVGHADSRAHAPDESIEIEHFHNTTRQVAEIINRFADI